MKIHILDCSIIQYWNPLKRAFSTSRITIKGNDNYIVVLSADVDGRQVRALGESAPRRALTGDPNNKVWPFFSAASDCLRGCTFVADDLQQCVRAIEEKLVEIATIGRRLVPAAGDGELQMRGCYSGVEIALLDLGAKAFGVSVAELLGGTPQPIRMTADTVSAGKAFGDRRKYLADRARRFPGWRVKGDSREEQNIGYLRGLTTLNREKKLNNLLWVDFNQALSFDAAKAFVERVAREHREGLIEGKIIFEQPTPQDEVSDLSKLQAFADTVRTDGLQIVIMADESLHTLSDWRAIARNGGCGAINIKIPKAGGLLASMRIAKEAIDKFPEIEVYIGGMLATSDVTSWAIYNLACVLSGFRYTTTSPAVNLEVNIAENVYSFGHPQKSIVNSPGRSGIGTDVDFSLLAGLARKVYPATAWRLLRNTAERNNKNTLQHSYKWPEAMHFEQLPFDSFLLQASALAHGMTTLRLTPQLFTSSVPEKPENTFGFWWSAGDFASRYGLMICGQKQLTRIMLRTSGVPVPQGRKFPNAARRSATDYARRIGWPVVVKPAAGGGGRAVTTNIRSEADLHAAIKAVKEGESFIVEKHVEGADYRILATEEKVISVFTRRAARVRGDGVSTIEQLVERANRLREAHPRYRNSLIKLTEKTVQHMLKRQGLSNEAIPAEDAEIILSPAANISQGGEGMDVTAETHPSILEFALQIRRGLPGLGHCGIDLLMEDHRKPMSEQSVGVCEVNSYSEIAMHCFPSEGVHADAAEELYLYNARRAGVEPGPRADLVSVAVQADGVYKTDGFVRWLTEIASTLLVSIEDVETGEDSVRFVATGWVHSVAAVAALAIAPSAAIPVEVVRTTPVAARTLPALKEPGDQKATSRVLVSGKVQGVGYRIWLQGAARARGVGGFVRNRSDGAVEAVLSGAQDAVAELQEAMRGGPERAEVTRLDIGAWKGTPPPENDFRLFKTVKLE